MNLGYLSPSGQFYICEYWGHGSLALRICHNIHKVNTDLLTPIQAETYLLNLGYLCIRSRDISYTHYCSKKYSDSICVNKSVINILTKAQRDYISEIFNNNSWNNLDQLDSMNCILKEDEDYKIGLNEEDDFILNPNLTKEEF